MSRPKTIADVDGMFVKVECRICSLGWHFAGFIPGSVTCPTCDPLPDGRLRRHYHRRRHPRRRIKHIIEGHWT